MGNVSQCVYASIAEKKNLLDVLTAFHSLRKLYPNSVLYLLCIESEVYSLLESMEYDDIYIIAHDELQERYPELITLATIATYKKYLASLHTFLLHYILHNNPYVYAVQYISPYIFWVERPHIETTKSITFLTHNGAIIPYYIYCHNTEQAKAILLQYQVMYQTYASSPSQAYMEEEKIQHMTSLLQMYPEDIDEYRNIGILYVDYQDNLQYKRDAIYVDEIRCYGIYMRYFLYSQYMYYTIRHPVVSWGARYRLHKYIKEYKKLREYMWYKCALFGLPLDNTMKINSILPFCSVQYSYFLI